jgi:hypothetical protein
MSRGKSTHAPRGVAPVDVCVEADIMESASIYNKPEITTEIYLSIYP